MTEVPRPSINPNQVLGQLAAIAVAKQFGDEGHVLDMTNIDYGKDAYVTFNYEGTAPGYTTILQFKGTKTHDTDSHQAFKFRCEAKTIAHLADNQAPAYLVVHNLNSGTSYAREAHEIVQFLDPCNPAWRSDPKKKINLTFQAETLLSPERVRFIAAEAHAWAVERDETLDTVKYLESEAEKFGAIRRSTTDGEVDSFTWFGFRGGFMARDAAESIQLQSLISNLMQGYLLCRIYRVRLAEGLKPHRLTSSGFGTFELTEHTKRLRITRARHEEFLTEQASLLTRMRPMPIDHADSGPAEKPPGFMPPNLDGVDAAAATAQMREYLERIGLGVSDVPGSPHELLVRCKEATSLFSFRIFAKARTSRKQVLAIRQRVVSNGATMGTILIKFCQLDTLGLEKWPRPKEPPRPHVPVATVAGGIDEALGALIESAAAAGSWPERSISAKEMQPLGWSARMLDGTLPDSDQAREYQKLMVGRYAVEALACLRRGDPAIFYFHWGLRRVEVHHFTSPAELVTYLLRGPAYYASQGGGISRAS